MLGDSRKTGYYFAMVTNANLKICVNSYTKIETPIASK